MAGTAPQYPLLVDTDALIAVANSSLWPLLTEYLGLTTTNICQQELKRHQANTSAHAPEGSRPYRLHHGSATALAALTDDRRQLPVSSASLARMALMQVKRCCATSSHSTLRRSIMSFSTPTGGDRFGATFMTKPSISASSRHRFYSIFCMITI